VYSRSLCRCGHTGDGPGSFHYDFIFGPAASQVRPSRAALAKSFVEPGGGRCMICSCPKFTWASFLPEYEKTFKTSRNGIN